jgi:transposase
MHPAWAAGRLIRRPAAHAGCIQRDYKLRELFNASRYVIRYGIAWRAMPNDFPPRSAAYQQAQRWLASGCFEALAQDLRAVLRLVAGREEEPTAAIIDSRTLRSTPESGPRAGYDGAKRKRGSKETSSPSSKPSQVNPIEDRLYSIFSIRLRMRWLTA